MLVKYYLFMLLLLSLPVSYGQHVVVDIQGLHGDLLENSKAALSIYKAQGKTEIASSDIQYLHNKASQQIKNALKPYGYYQVTVKTQLEEKVSKNYWLATYQVDAGKVLKIRKLQLMVLGEGQQDASYLKVLDNAPIMAGDDLNQILYQQLKNSLQEIAPKKGYFDAKWQKTQITIDMKQYVADIELLYDSGKRYCFSEVRVNQDYFKDAILKQYITIKAGDKYDPKALIDTENKLYNTGYFERVKVSTEKSSAHCLRVNISLTRIRKRNYNGRLGFGTDSGLRTSFEIAFPYLNRRGHIASTEFGFTQTRNKQLINLSYILPSNQHREKYYGVSFDFRAKDFKSEDVDIEDVQGKTRVVDLTFKLHQTQRRDFFNFSLQEEYSLNYLLESYEILPLLFTEQDIDLVRSLLSNEELEVLTPDYNVLFFGIKWGYTQADNKIYSSAGQHFEAKIKAAKKGLLSNVTFAQLRLSARVIRKFMKKSRIIVRAEAAFTNVDTVESLNANVIPKDLQFRLGGDKTIRGYGFEEISGGEDTLVSGKHQLVGSAEYEYTVYPKVSVATFFDIGNVFNSTTNLKYKKSVGIGMRWQSPIGQVRVDFAFPLDDKDNNFGFHLVIGPDF